MSTKKLPKPLPLSYWLSRIERLIVKHSTKPRTRGKYKGHASTDALGWVWELANEIQADIRRCNRGIGYDGNMALASRLGAALFAWYSNVHRAKSLDPNRPLKIRQKVQRYRADVIASFICVLNSDALMAKTWPHQEFNIPFGSHAKGGKFV